MNQVQFKQSMERILAFMATPKTPEDEKHLEQYLKALFEQISRWDAFMFDQVTKEVARSLTAGRKPAIRDFEAIYSRMREALPKTEFKCVPCNTTGWVQVMLMDQHTGTLERFSKPCPECRSAHPLLKAPLRQGWIEAEMPQRTEPDAKTQHFIDSLLNTTSAGPQNALDEITRRWHLGDFQLDSLTKFMERVTPPTHKEEQRKNGLVRAMVTTVPVHARETASPPPRETPASGPPAGVVGAGSVEREPLFPPEGGVFKDGSRLDDPDIPF